LVKWSVSFAGQPARNGEGEKMAYKGFIVGNVKNVSRRNIAIWLAKKGIMELIPKLVCNSVGIRGIARVLDIAVNTVVRLIKRTAEAIEKPPIPLHRKSFEIDEVRTFIGNKSNQYWVAYVLCSDTKQIIDFIVGKRSKKILRIIVNTALCSRVKVIKTDRLNIYKSLIPTRLHLSNAYNINYIERNNLNLRTHLKRLSRRTICFSRSLVMLSACLKIYFWYQ
jgi:insertion element IS1 protein InsB